MREKIISKNIKSMFLLDIREYKGIEKVEIIDAIVNDAGESDKEEIRIYNVREAFGRTKLSLIEITTSITATR